MERARSSLSSLLLLTLTFFLSCGTGESQKSSEAKESATASADKTTSSESSGTLSVKFKRHPKLKDFQEGVAEHYPGVGPTGRPFGVYHIVLSHTYSQGNDVSIQFDTKGDEKPVAGKYPVWTESQPEKGYAVIVVYGHTDGDVFTNQASDGELEILSSGEEIVGQFRCTIATGGEPATAEGSFTAVYRPK